jgi:hypothetical protein
MVLDGLESSSEWPSHASETVSESQSASQGRNDADQNPAALPPADSGEEAAEASARRRPMRSMISFHKDLFTKAPVPILRELQILPLFYESLDMHEVLELLPECNLRYAILISTANKF